MRKTQDATMDMEGIQKEERTITTRIVIDYQSSRYKYSKQNVGGDWLFSFSPHKAPIRKTTDLDPYAVRRAFEAVDNEDAAVQFLSDAGNFWFWPSVTWPQFREWQEYFRWLRLSRDKADKSPEGKKAWVTAEEWKNQFFKGTDSEFTHARFRGVELPPDAWKKNKRIDEYRLRHLRRFAFNPYDPSTLDGGTVALLWQEMRPEAWKKNEEPDESRTQFRKFSLYPESKGHALVGVYRIQVRCILEAIAATVFVDRACNLKIGECKFCHKAFERKSDHGQEFCCSSHKNAFLQRRHREKIKAEKKKAEREAKKARKAAKP